MPRTWWIFPLMMFAIGLDILVGGAVSWWRFAVNTTVLIVIGCTISYGLRAGLGIAAFGSLLFALTSVLNPWPHTVGLALAATIVWFVSHRIVASRSTISFLSSIIAATASFGLATIGTDLLLNLVTHQPVRLALPPMLVATFIQLVTHPTILFMYWRVLGRNRYHQLTTTYSQTF